MSIPEYRVKPCRVHEYKRLRRYVILPGGNEPLRLMRVAGATSTNPGALRQSLALPRKIEIKLADGLTGTIGNGIVANIQQS